MLTATTAAAAVAIVTLSGGFLMTGFMPDRSDGQSSAVAPAASTTTAAASEVAATTSEPEAEGTEGPEPSSGDRSTTAQDAGAASAAIELPGMIPDDIPSGKLRTPFGPARWVHLKGDAETLPDFIDPIPAPGGHVVLEEGGGGFGPCPEGDVCQSYAKLWFTPDLLEWTERPLPIAADHGRLVLADGHYWFIAQDAHDDYEPPTIWRSTDTLDWHPIDLAGLTPPEPAFLEWRPEFGEVAVSGGAAVAPVTFRAAGLRGLLGLEDTAYDSFGWVSLGALDDGDYSARGGYGEELATLRFEQSDSGLTVIDAASGAELATLEGVGMDLIERWARPKDPRDTEGWSGVLIEHGIAVIDGDAATMVETPDPTPGMRSQPVLGTSDGFTLFSVQDAGTIRTWRSQDGLDWVSGELIGDEPGEPFGVDFIHVWPSGLLAGGEKDGKWRSWDSTDGTTWRKRVEPRTDGAYGPLGPGFVAFDEKGISFYEDGKRVGKRLEAKRLRLKGEPNGAGGAGVSVISPNTISLSVSEDERRQGYRRDHWIITFDRLPEAD